MTSAYFKSLEPTDQARYLQKLTFDENILPDPYDGRKKSYFIDDCTQWPKVEYPFLFAYLVETPGIYTSETLKSYKSLEAYNFFYSGKVRNIRSHKNEGSNVILMCAEIAPSQRDAGKNNAQCHNPWITARPSGEVISGHCNCMAGLGEVCSHVAALLFTIEAAVREGLNNKTCTSKPCTWKNVLKQVSPAPIAAIDFTKPKRQRDSPRAQYQHLQKPYEISNCEPSKFLDALRVVNKNAAVFTLFDSPDSSDDINEDIELSADGELPKPLTHLYREDASLMSEDDFESLCIATFDSLTITPEEIKALEKATQLQSSSETWHEQRKGRITASLFHQVKNIRDATSPVTLITKIMGYTSDSFSVPALNWGRHNENAAREELISLMKPTHSEFTIHPVGLTVNSLWPYLGASPDGVTKCNCCSDSLVEIKCPFKYRDHDLSSAFSDPSFCLDSNKKLKKNHSYYSQVQGQLGICNKQLCYFVVWTPQQTIVDEVMFDHAFFQDMQKNLEEFFVFNILQELLTRRLDSAEIEGAEQIFCVCKTPESGKMIACDADKCTTIWYHFKCVNLSRKPRGKWICPTCSLQEKHTASNHS